jgi:hypothetical protein
MTVKIVLTADIFQHELTLRRIIVVISLPVTNEDNKEQNDQEQKAATNCTQN